MGGVIPYISLDDIVLVVRRAVVNYDYLVLICREILIYNGIKAVVNVFLRIVSGNDDGKLHKLER